MNYTLTTARVRFMSFTEGKFITKMGRNHLELAGQSAARGRIIQGSSSLGSSCFLFLFLTLAKGTKTVWSDVVSFPQKFDVASKIGARAWGEQKTREKWPGEVGRGWAREERILLFWVNSVLKSSLWGFNHKQNVSVKLRRRYQMNFIRHGYPQ